MLSNFENFSITRELTSYLNDLNNSGTVEGMIFSRAIGFVSLPFTCLADFAVHISFAALKIITGIGSLFYNLLAYGFFPSYRATSEYELSSSIIHIMQTIQSLIRGIFFPFLCAIDPEKTKIFANGIFIQPPIQE